MILKELFIRGFREQFSGLLSEVHIPKVAIAYVYGRHYGALGGPFYHPNNHESCSRAAMFLAKNVREIMPSVDLVAAVAEEETCEE